MKNQFNNLLQIFRNKASLPNVYIVLDNETRVSFAGKVVGRESPDSPQPTSNMVKKIDPLLDWIVNNSDDSHSTQTVIASMSINNRHIRSKFVNQHLCDSLGKIIETISQRKNMRR